MTCAPVFLRHLEFSQGHSLATAARIVANNVFAKEQV